MSVPRLPARCRPLLGKAVASALIACMATLPLTGIAKPISPSGIAASAASSPAEASTGVDAAAQFESVPSPMPLNLDSLVFAATGTTEFGDLIRLRGDSHFVGTVAVTMTSGASRQNYPNYPGSSAHGFYHPVTLTFYTVNRDGPVPTPGTVLARITEPVLIPWRPDSGPGSLLPARAFNASFDVVSLGIALPDEVIFGISFNTRFHGPAPLGQPGPYDVLGVAVNHRPVSAGSDIDANAVFWHTTHAEATPGRVEFRQDTGWLPYKPAVRFRNSLYGSLFELVVRLECARGPDSRENAATGLAAALIALAIEKSLWYGNGELQPVLGRYAFELLAEAADEVAPVAAGDGALASDARTALDTILTTANMLANSAVADAIILRGNINSLLEAQAAIDLAIEDEADTRFGDAVDQYGQAWQQAQAALR